MNLRACLVMGAALAFGGCAHRSPIYDVIAAPIVAPPGKQLTLSEVSRAIVAAGNDQGWQIHPESPGHLTGRLVIRTHLAVVDIEHDTKAYSIKYRDSTDLDARDGMIHRLYRGWIENLDQAIRARLAH